MGIREFFHHKAKRLNEKGREILDPTPMAPPVGYKRQPSLSEQIREMVRSERLAMEAASAGFETLEEADDFDIPDDPIDPRTPYEAHFDPLPEMAPPPPAKASPEPREPISEPSQAKESAPAPASVERS